MTITPARTSNAREKRALVCSNEPTGECNPRIVGSAPQPLREKRDPMKSTENHSTREQAMRPAPSGPLTRVQAAVRAVLCSDAYALRLRLLAARAEPGEPSELSDDLTPSEYTNACRRIAAEVRS